MLASYKKEISFLRQMGSIFSQKYPKIARRLNLGKNESTDPHVERLLESFAFLTAFLQQDIDNQFPRISHTLLNLICPNLSHPLPPLSIARFFLDPQKPMTTCAQVPQGTGLYASDQDGAVCHFKTSYPLELWPIEMQEVCLEKTEKYTFGDQITPYSSVLRLTLKAGATPFNKLAIKKLRFYINASHLESPSIYELLFSDPPLLSVTYDAQPRPWALPADCMKPVGLSVEELVLPAPANGNMAYTLLQEYFNFPEKFMFFDLEGLDFSRAESLVNLFIPVQNTSPLETISFSKDTFALGCTPIINLFPRITEPLTLDHQSVEYPLVPDYRREMTTEIHSVERMFSMPTNAASPEEVYPYFSFSHAASQGQGQRFWNARRVPALNPEVPGTDLMISFVNCNMGPETPPSDVVYAHALVTNRHLAPLVASGTPLKCEQETSCSLITCLRRPTRTVYASVEGKDQWKLISSLSLNFLSLSNAPNSLEALKELLMLFTNPDSALGVIDINALKKMSVSPAVERMDPAPWKNFVKGLHITLEIGTDGDDSGRLFLFGSVLNAFVGLYAHTNSFTQLSIIKENREGIWKTWPARAGSKALV